MKRKSIKLWLSIGCAILLFSSSLFAYFYHSHRRIPVVKTLLAQRGDLIQSVSASGVVVAKDPVTVEAKVSGKIKEVYVEDGQEVKKGDLLVEIEEDALNKQIDAAKAQLATAKANLSRLQGGSAQQGIESSKLNLSQAKIALEEAERNLKSTKLLYDAKAIAKEQLTLAEAQVEKAKLAYDSAKRSVSYAKSAISSSEIEAAQIQVKQAESAVMELEEKIGDTIIVAPASGVVNFNQPLGTGHLPLGTNLKAGSMITENTPLFTILKPKKLQVQASVDELHANNLYIGQEAEITAESLPNVKLKGKVSKVGKATTTSSSGIPSVELLVDVVGDPKRLKIGSQVDIELMTTFKRNVLLLPKRAVKNVGRQKVAYVVEKHSPPRAYQRILKIGAENENVVEVLGGVSENEDVIVIGVDKVSDRKRVRLE